MKLGAKVIVSVYAYPFEYSIGDKYNPNNMKLFIMSLLKSLLLKEKHCMPVPFLLRVVGSVYPSRPN